MKLFITGGTGFIGNHVLEKLCEMKCFHIGVLTRQKKHVTKGVSYIEGSICDVSLIEDLVRQNDYVIHMAGCKNDLKSFFQTNIKGTENIINACRKSNNLKKLIYLSSVGVIGKTNNAVVDEQTECHPNNDYEKSKYQAELIVREYAKERPGDVIILRPTNVFGENDPELHLLNLIRKIKNRQFYFVGKDESHYYLNYLYVREISELVPIFLRSNARSGVYIINTPTSLLEFITTIKEILEDGTPVKHIPYGPIKLLAKCFDMIPRNILKHPPVNSLKLSELTNRKQYSSALLAAEFGWKPMFTMKQAMNNLISHYNKRKLLT